MYRLVRGVDLSPIEPRTRVKSIGASKNVTAIPSHASPALGKFAAVLCEEVAARVVEDHAKYSRLPCRLTVHYRCRGVVKSKVVRTASFVNARCVGLTGTGRGGGGLPLVRDALQLLAPL